MVKNSDALELALWKEVSLHRSMAEYAARAWAILQGAWAIPQLSVRWFDEVHLGLLSIAFASSHQGQNFPIESKLNRQDGLGLKRWCRRGIPSTGSGLSAHLKSLIFSNPKLKELAIPLGQPNGPWGILNLTWPAKGALRHVGPAFTKILRETFTAALENHLRIHELATLREAAEAERGALWRRLGKTPATDEVIVGETTGLKLVMDRVQAVVKLAVPVLILGETGTGKEVIARSLHQRSDRTTGPFIRVNCGAIPTELIDSQLFGHEKGSFTSADSRHAGWFERADGGTLFLDEIGELPLEAQVRLLRVLQDGLIERVGGRQSVHVDVRLVAATHRDLLAMVREGKFREDLWYRVSVFPIRLPPLRERMEDIGRLAKHFAERAALRFGLPIVEPSLADVKLLSDYNWPGNIRELGAVIDRAAILGEGRGLATEKALGFGSQMKLPSMHPPTSTYSEGDQYSKWSLDAVMKGHIERALGQSQGKIEGRDGAAKLLDINPNTLRARMRKLNIKWQNFRNSNASTGD